MLFADRSLSTKSNPVGTEIMQVAETVEVDNEKVACEGAGGALGHPKVFLNLRGKGSIDCPYCSKRFVLKQS
jgi:uncharacterized Zn-finger protein